MGYEKSLGASADTSVVSLAETLVDVWRHSPIRCQDERYECLSDPHIFEEVLSDVVVAQVSRGKAVQVSGLVK